MVKDLEENKENKRLASPVIQDPTMNKVSPELTDIEISLTDCNLNETDAASDTK